ncbi:hypothetical protein AAFF_G00287630 [Aldrovandia affinis]|uniref:Protein sprouty homolog 2 n=1 Tax=Aldrovandia affinis TaxID=143900 RepID=A0AAD7SQP3_9TELE|nr:hypothetical protein AAFF_G00287630 [Aldrovandia affinis]
MLPGVATVSDPGHYDPQLRGDIVPGPLFMAQAKRSEQSLARSSVNARSRGANELGPDTIYPLGQQLLCSLSLPHDAIYCINPTSSGKKKKKKEDEKKLESTSFATSQNKKGGCSGVSTDFRCVQCLQERSLFRENMETRTQNGGGSPGLLRALHDSGRHAGDSDPREASGQQVQVLSLDQIRIIRSTNEYTEGPMVAPRPGGKQVTAFPPSQQKTEPAQGPTIEQEQQRLAQRGPSHHHHHHVHTSPTAFTRSVSTMSTGSRSSTRTSASSASSEQRLLENPPSERIIRAQPKPPDAKAEELKPFAEELAKHTYRCEDCGKCRCEECTCPRALPSCWVCGRRCVCSAQNLLDYGTCVCCVKCLFYHCSSDDEDVCADKPCSCGQSHCCVRWSAMGVLSVFLPCLLCYLPAKGCLRLSQCCYDRVKRPGCRCKNANVVHCKNVEKLT